MKINLPLLSPLNLSFSFYCLFILNLIQSENADAALCGNVLACYPILFKHLCSFVRNIRSVDTIDLINTVYTADIIDMFDITLSIDTVKANNDCHGLKVSFS